MSIEGQASLCLESCLTKSDSLAVMVTNRSLICSADLLLEGTVSVTTSVTWVEEAGIPKPVVLWLSVVSSASLAFAGSRKTLVDADEMASSIVRGMCNAVYNVHWE